MSKWIILKKIKWGPAFLSPTSSIIKCLYMANTNVFCLYLVFAYVSAARLSYFIRYAKFSFLPLLFSPAGHILFCDREFFAHANFWFWSIVLLASLLFVCTSSQLIYHLLLGKPFLTLQTRFCSSLSVNSPSRLQMGIWCTRDLLEETSVQNQRQVHY